MTIELQVLCALFHVSRRRQQVRSRHLLLRVGHDVQAIRKALRVLERANLVLLGKDGPRLSLTGLAIAAASSAVARPAPRAKRLAGKVTRVALTRRAA